MSELRSALEGLRAEDLRAASDDALEADYDELQRAADALEVERLRRLAELDRRRPYLRDGYLSTSTWVSQRFRVGFSAAAGDVRMARALEVMPQTQKALADGEVSRPAAHVLVAAREADHEAFAESEPVLVEAARRCSVRDLQRAVAHWRGAVEDRRRVEGHDDPLRERRRLHVSPTVFGMVRIDGDLDPDTGETVLTALQSCLDAEAHSGDPRDRRTPGQQRADALGEICRRWLDAPERPQVGGERPHVTVTVDLEALSGRPGQAELDHAGPVSAEAARLWACDASVSRVIARGRSEPLDVGRRTPTVPAGMRRAVVVRDRECRFPGCDRPPPWCDAHHVRHWANGGVTALSNLVLLCRRHHRMVHQGFGLTMADGRPVFRRPDGVVLDGVVLEDRAPP